VSIRKEINNPIIHLAFKKLKENLRISLFSHIDDLGALCFKFDNGEPYVLGLITSEDNKSEVYIRVNEMLKSHVCNKILVLFIPGSLQVEQDFEADEFNNTVVEFNLFREYSGPIVGKIHIHELFSISDVDFSWLEERMDYSVLLKIFRDAIVRLQRSMTVNGPSGMFYNSLFVGGKITGSIAKQCAAFYLLNQIIFHRIFSVKRSEVEKVDVINDKKGIDPIDLARHFEKLVDFKEGNDASIDISSISKDMDLSALREIICLINLFCPERIPSDALSRMIQHLMPFPFRKKIASFFTLEPAARLLAGLLIDDARQKVCDPACGSGSLLSAAYDAKKRLLETEQTFEDIDHVRFLSEEIIGVDLIPYATQLAAMNLLLKNPNVHPPRIQIYVADSNFLEVRDVKSEDRGRDLDRDGNSIFHDMQCQYIKEPDIILMNPPYTRKQRLAIKKWPSNAKVSGIAGYKRELFKRYKEYHEKKLINGYSPYYSFFLCLADKLLGPKIAYSEKKVIGAVLPAIFLRNRGELELRKYLMRNYWIKYLIFREDSPMFSDDTGLREVIVILEKLSSNSNIKDLQTAYVFLHELKTNNVEKLIHDLKKVHKVKGIPIHENIKYSASGFSLVLMPQIELEANNMFIPASLFSFNYDYTRAWTSIRDKKPFISLGNIKGIEIQTKNFSEPTNCRLKFSDASIVERGKCISKKDFVLKEINDSSLIIYRNDDRNNLLEVPKQACNPCVRYCSRKARMDLTDLKEYVIKADFKGFPVLGVNWASWNHFLEKRTSNLAIADRIDYTTDGYHLLAFYSDRKRVIARSMAMVRIGVPLQEKLLTIWLNSTFGLLEWLFSRSPQRFGYSQHHSYSLKELIVPDLSNLVNAKDLDELWQAIRNLEVPCLFKQYIRLMSLDLVEEFKDFLKRHDLLEIAAIGLPMKRKIDEFIINFIKHVLDGDSFRQLITVLNKKDGSGPFSDANRINERLRDVNFSTTTLQNLHDRTARLLIYSKIAMENRSRGQKKTNNVAILGRI